MFEKLDKIAEMAPKVEAFVKRIEVFLDLCAKSAAAATSIAFLIGFFWLSYMISKTELREKLKQIFRRPFVYGVILFTSAVYALALIWILSKGKCG